jgi:hypothetical protein
VTFTYDDTASVWTDLTRIRRRIGDTDSDDALLTDEEINDQLSLTDEFNRAAAECVRAILGKMARDVDRTGTGYSATRSQKFQHYKDLLKDLDAEANLQASVELTGGTKSGIEEYESDSDFVQFPFKKGLHDNEAG